MIFFSQTQLQLFTESFLFPSEALAEFPLFPGPNPIMPLTTAFWLLIAIPWQGQGTPRNKKEIDLLHAVPGKGFQSNMLCQIAMPQSSQLICAILD